jgi:hypothetical protein
MIEKFGKDLEGSDYDVIDLISGRLLGSQENNEKCQSA